MNKVDVVIIGGGPVTVSFLYQLEEKLAEHRQLQVVIFEKSANYAKGYAYRGNNEELILNTPAEDMGVLPSQIDDFSHWLKKNYTSSNLSEQKFLPRYLFGCYLQEKFNEIVARNNKLKIQIIQEEVINCTLSEHQQHTVSSSNYAITASAVIFIHGGAIMPAYPEFSQQENYIADIYDANISFSTLKNRAKVLLLGSNLSMIDACLLLKQSRKEFEITAASRSAYFPALKPYQLKHVEGEVLVAEASKVFDGSKNRTASDLIAFLDQHFSRLLAKNYSVEANLASYNQALCRTPLSDVDVDANFLAYFYPYIDACIDKSWFVLSHAEKQKLLDICRYLIRFICGFPESNFNKLKAYFGDKNLLIEKLVSVSFENNLYQACFQSNPEQLQSYDYLIDCTGMKGYYSPKNPQALAINMRRNKQIKIDDDGGVAVDENARVYDGCTNKAYKTVYALGEGSSGQNFIRGCFSFYVKQTAIAVESLVANYNE